MADLTHLRSQPRRTRAFVGGFGNDAGELELKAAFLSVGVELDGIEVVVSAATGCSRGFAFVTLPVEVALAPPSKGAGPAPEVTPPPREERAILDRMRTATVRGRPLTIQTIPLESFPRPPTVGPTS
jgi:hypothetical protein